MNKTTIIVGSVTQAIKLKKLLLRSGVGSIVVKVDNTENNIGCSHGVEIFSQDFYKAVMIMRENNINYLVKK